MGRFDKIKEAEYAEYLSYLYKISARQYRDCEEIENVIQETMLAFLTKLQNGETVAHPKGFLSATLQNQYNSYLRRKHKDQLLVYDYLDELEAEDMIAETEETDSKKTEYENTRREIGRLIRIYREVIVRHYVHGHSVEKIAADLGIPRGTVLSRLSSAREQIKKGLSHMKKYTSASYEPRRVALSVRGYLGLESEPRSLIHSPIEQNILILAYEKPLTVRRIADAIGIPCAYLEPIVDALVQGELMGQTPSGLVYTRCLLVKNSKRYGDIPAQEDLAGRMAERAWQIAYEHFKAPMERACFIALSDKQKATLILSLLYQMLFLTVEKCNPVIFPVYDQLPERPNGGKWYATGVVYEPDEEDHPVYMVSGPIQHRHVTDSEKNVFQMIDCQSVFGDTTFAYRRFKYHFTTERITSFYASLLPGGKAVEDFRIYEMIPRFLEMHTIRRNRCGALRLAIPALPFDELERHWYPARTAAAEALFAMLGEELTSIMIRGRQQVPRHVDGRRYHEYSNALSAYPTAQLLAIINRGLLPYKITIGETPLAYLAYRYKE